MNKSWKATDLLCENSDDIHFGGDKISVTFCKMEHYLPELKFVLTVAISGRVKILPAA